ncbi:TIM barrel protein [Olivibacter sp. SDN3]|uniref:sugar phosphate isomerase/epimerase family protein n=1 Tax=Olivibacter sp. SDN3 TaxID=2764720 RepID=UPI0016511A1D|nr:TIM barrel protein [Olivibacter sp. SDN3]QNL50606.1 TIM barrel protein [Olivibacter sp. SDN3]
MSLNRRLFLERTAIAATGGLLGPFGKLMAHGKHQPVPVFAQTGFELLFMATNWGFGGTIADFCAQAKQAGYDGVELWWPGDNEVARKELFTALKRHNLQVGFLCGGSGDDVDDHFEKFVQSVDASLQNNDQKPIYINCHSGSDFFNYEQNVRFIDYTTEKAKTSGIPIYHETHRGRMLYTAPVTQQFISQKPDLRLTLDISHWCVVHESLLANQNEVINKCLERVDHIHSRVGHAEGPQVGDPRAPEWQEALQAHLAWWDKVLAYKKRDGKRMTILTEFGPPDYLPTLPYTRQPVANQWDINVYMMEMLRERYG